MPLIRENRVQLFDIIRQGEELRASDIDISPGKPILFRVDGIVKPYSHFKDIGDTIIKEEDTYSFLEDYLNNDARARYDKRKSYDISINIGSTRARIHFYESVNGVSVSCRLIPLKPRSMQELLIPEIVKDWSKRNGIIVVSGLTNTGKTTTLASIVDHINSTRNEKITILEDPIEYIHDDKKSYIFQREVGLNSPSYADSLRDVLRENTDTIIVGEIRHMDAMDAVFTMAEAGLKIFTSLHANSVIETIERIVNMFPPSDYERIYKRLSWTLTGIITQRLLPKRKGGRVLACELLSNNNSVSKVIREGKIQSLNSYLEEGQEDMCSFDKYIKKLELSGII